jgi:single-strand DNA-binding protein
MSINKVILVGNVGKDPVVRYFDKGVAKATFPLATSETYTNQQGETITSTEWHNIVLWRALAEVAEKTIKKGSQVYIVGKIKTRSYVDKDGVNKYITEILADTLLLLEKKQTAGTSSAHTEIPKSETQSGSLLNEPPASYNPANDNNNKNLADKAITPDDDFGIDSRPGSAQNEDDLPF